MDANEIYQAVLTECIEKIDRIKSEYGEELVGKISDRLSRQYSNRIDSLEKQNKDLTQRLAKLEKSIKSGNAGEETKSRATSISSSTADLMIARASFSKFEFNGWLYYTNKKMGDFLYRIRTDGTGKEQLTDYSVYFSNPKVKNGRLYFKDADFKEHSVEIK